MFTLSCDNCGTKTTNPFKSGYIEVSVKPMNRNNRVTKHLCPKCADNPIIANLLGSKTKTSETQPVENNIEDSANKEE